MDIDSRQLLEGKFITLKDVDQAIRALQGRIAELEKQRKEISSMPPEQVLAQVLHDSLCRWNHDDGCSWFYGSWDKPSHAHKEYLMKARKLLDRAGGDLQKALDLADLVRDLR